MTRYSPRERRIMLRQDERDVMRDRARRTVNKLKCPYCNSSLRYNVYDCRKLPWLGRYFNEPMFWAMRCGSCGFQGPMKPSKREARDVVMRKVV